ncbi:DUF6870 family protein [Sporobacter termitidis]|uniref:DUF6870 family protein n=1 Tax=Sporobacter termitidis TaxID=44749 RepID=UPI001FA8E9E7|nr:hypothetical protein [Sporobacter termitidis]
MPAIYYIKNNITLSHYTLLVISTINIIIRTQIRLEVIVLLTSEQIKELYEVDITTVDKYALPDVSQHQFDYSLSQQERMEEMIRVTGGNPFCYRYGDMLIKLEFDDTKPPLQEVFTNFLIRMKSGL